MQNEQRVFAAGEGAYIKRGAGDPRQSASGISAQADRAVMLRTEPTCLALPAEIAPKPSPKEPTRALSNMVAQNTRFLPIRVSISCAHEMNKDHSPFLVACGGFGQAERPTCVRGKTLPSPSGKTNRQTRVVAREELLKQLHVSVRAIHRSKDRRHEAHLPAPVYRFVLPRPHPRSPRGKV